MVQEIHMPATRTRVTVEDYHTMIANGQFQDGDAFELLDGEIVSKMTQNTLHAAVSEEFEAIIRALVGRAWSVRSQKPITLARSEPDPDLVISSGTFRTHLLRHPLSADIALVVEVSDSSLAQDQGVKQAIYAQAELPIYWILNLVDLCVEVYTQPIQTPTPHYTQISRYVPGDELPLILAGVEMGRLAVSDFLVVQGG